MKTDVHLVIPANAGIQSGARAAPRSAGFPLSQEWRAEGRLAHPSFVDTNMPPRVVASRPPG